MPAIVLCLCLSDSVFVRVLECDSTRGTLCALRGLAALVVHTLPRWVDQLAEEPPRYWDITGSHDSPPHNQQFRESVVT